MDAVIDSSKAITWCASRRCRGSVTEVAAYLATRFAVDPTIVAAPGRLTVVTGAPNGVATVGPVRAHRAKLAFGAWRPATKVTIEVVPWSRSESELLVRPTRRPPLAEDAYFASVLAVLETLGAEIKAALPPVSELAPDQLETPEQFRRAS
jgi:hypothetical protein